MIKASAFADVEITSIKIPSEISQIEESAFYNCKYLRQIDFANESKLQIIGSFEFSVHAKIFIESKFLIIQNLKSFEDSILIKSSIESINILPNFTRIEKKLLCK